MGGWNLSQHLFQARIRVQPGQVYHRANKCWQKKSVIPEGNFEFPAQLTWMSLDCGEKLENLEETHTSWIWTSDPLAMRWALWYILRIRRQQCTWEMLKMQLPLSPCWVYFFKSWFNLKLFLSYVKDEKFPTFNVFRTSLGWKYGKYKMQHIQNCEGSNSNGNYCQVSSTMIMTREVERAWQGLYKAQHVTSNNVGFCTHLAIRLHSMHRSQWMMWSQNGQTDLWESWWRFRRPDVAVCRALNGDYSMKSSATPRMSQLC